MTDDWMKQYPSVWVTRTYDGDRERAKMFFGEGNKLLYQLKNRMMLGDLGQLKMTRLFTDGTVVIAKSVFGHDEIHIYAPPTVEEVLVPTYIGLPLVVIYDRTENKMFFEYLTKTGDTNPPLRKYIDLNGVILAPTLVSADTSTWIGLVFLQPVEYYGEAGVFFYWPTYGIRINPLVYRYLVKKEKPNGVDVTYEGHIFKQYNFDYDFIDPDVIASVPGNPGLPMINNFTGYFTYYWPGFGSWDHPNEGYLAYSGITMNYASGGYFVMSALPHCTGQPQSVKGITFELACMTFHQTMGSISAPNPFEEGNPLTAISTFIDLPFVDIMNEKGGWIAHYNPCGWRNIFFAQGAVNAPLFGFTPGPGSPALYTDSEFYPIIGWKLWGPGWYAPEFFPDLFPGQGVKFKSPWWVTNADGNFISIIIPFSMSYYQWVNLYLNQANIINEDTRLFSTYNNVLLLNEYLCSSNDYFYPPFQNIGTANRIAGSLSTFSSANFPQTWPIAWDGTISVYDISNIIYDPTMTIPSGYMDAKTYPYGRQIKEMSLIKSVYNLNKMPVEQVIVSSINPEELSFIFKMDGYDDKTENSSYYKRLNYPGGQNGFSRIPSKLSAFAAQQIIV